MIWRMALIGFLMVASAIAEEGVLGQGEFRYRIVKDWGKAALAKVAVKNGHALAVDEQGRLIFLTDEPRNNVVILDAGSGALLEHWTARMPGAHGMALVREGDKEVVYITDTALHEVRKLTLKGEELARYGWPKESGLYAKADEYRPSKILVHPNGDFWVLDGYGKDYVHHYSGGVWKRSWGGNLGEGENQLPHWGPHGGALDLRDESAPRLLIAMSDKLEIKRFTLEGQFVDKVRMPGGNPRDVMLWGEVAVIPHLGDQWPKDKNAPGFVSILNREGRVVSNIGGPEAVYEGQTLLEMRSDGESFLHPHAVAVDPAGNLFVAQYASPAMPLMKLERVK